jgi:hypothetical protein
MSVRRQATRLAIVCGLLGGLVAVGASPALADEDSVRVRAASSFNANGSPGGVSVEVRKRTDGCVMVGTVLALRLDGLSADQVQVQVASDGHWVPVSVSGGGNGVVTGRTSPANPTLCKGKSVTVRYRVAFLPGAPAGRLQVVGEASAASGRVLGRGADTSKVVGKLAGSGSPTPSRKPSPTPSAVATVPATAEENAVAAAGDTTTGRTTSAAEESSGGSMYMFIGIALVLVGAGLIALLVRRSRADKEPAEGYSAYPGVPQPRNTGGTTYRSGGGAPGATPPPSGPGYGPQQQPVRPAGGVYGGTPAPRPNGGVYGGQPNPPAPGGQPPVPPSAPAGGDATTFMPRLPG